MSARWLIDLSPGTRTAPSTVAAPFTRVSVIAALCPAGSRRPPHVPEERGRGRGAAAGMRPHGVEKRRPDDGGLAASAQRLQVFVTAQAKTEGAGKSGGGTHAVEHLKGLGGNLGAYSRGAGDADAVDEPARAATGPVDALVGGRRRHQRGQCQAVGGGRRADVARLVGGQVGNDDAVHPGGRRGGAEGVDAVAQ